MNVKYNKSILTKNINGEYVLKIYSKNKDTLINISKYLNLDFKDNTTYNK